MHLHAATTLDDIRAVYNGPEGELWKLIMGEQMLYMRELAHAGKIARDDS